MRITEAIAAASHWSGRGPDCEDPRSYALMASRPNSVLQHVLAAFGDQGYRSRRATDAEQTEPPPWQAAGHKDSMVIRSSNRNTSTELTKWNSRFSTCIGPGRMPNTWQSSRYESQVRGCQLADSKDVKAQQTGFGRKPTTHHRGCRRHTNRIVEIDEIEAGHPAVDNLPSICGQREAHPESQGRHLGGDVVARSFPIPHSAFP